MRVLSSESGKTEPDIVTNPFDAELKQTSAEEEKIIALKRDNMLDEAEQEVQAELAKIREIGHIL